MGPALVDLPSSNGGVSETSEEALKSTVYLLQDWFAPSVVQEKVKDCRIFSLSRFSYGWVGRFPLLKWCRGIDAKLWKVLGHFQQSLLEFVVFQQRQLVTFRLFPCSFSIEEIAEVKSWSKEGHF